MTVGAAVALVGVSGLATGCGGTLEDDYRKGKVPGQSPNPTGTTTDPDGALGVLGPGATMHLVERMP